MSNPVSSLEAPEIAPQEFASEGHSPRRRGRRAKTEPPGDPFVEPTEDIWQLAEDYARRANLPQVDLDTSDEVIDAAFGRQGSWHVSGAMPTSWFFSKPEEAPFTIREMVMLPKAARREVADALLHDWGAAAINIKGMKGECDRTIGQDNFCIARLSSGWEVLAVFDGHGEYGHFPSCRAARLLPYFLETGTCAVLMRSGQIEEALRRAFVSAQADLINQCIDPDVNLHFSGTTAVVVLRHAGHGDIWVATVGDSRAVLFSLRDGVLEETSDHKPSRKDEADRITQVGTADIIEESYEDGFVQHRVSMRKGNKRSSAPYGICMTRSLGDFVYKECGVTAEPEVVKWSLEGREGAHVLLCSDGVWEFLASHEAVELVLTKGRDPLQARRALQELLSEAIRAWKYYEDGCYVDDITMVLAPVTGPPARHWDDAVIAALVEERRPGPPQHSEARRSCEACCVC